jgi:ParB family chromosome partitioning protein
VNVVCASKLLALPLFRHIRIANDNESLKVMALVENINADLDPIEIALSYQRLIDEIPVNKNK